MTKSIGEDAVKLTISKTVTMTISMISAMLLSRFRSLEEFGTYSQILMIINLVTTIFMFGLPNSINYFLARAETDDDRQKYLSVYYTLSTIISFFVGLALIASTPLIVAYFNNPLITNFWYILAIFPWARMIMASITNVLIVYRKTNYLISFQIMHGLLLLMALILVQVFGFSFTAYMIAFIVIESCMALCVYAIVQNVSGKVCFNIDVHLIKKILKFSVPLGLASIVGTISIQLDKLIIGRFYNTEQLAIYTNAARELPVAIIATSITAVVLPVLARLLRDEKKEKALGLWGDAATLSFIFICFFSMALFVFAPEVLNILYSEKYIAGKSVFRIYSLILLFRFTYFGIILNSVGKTKFIFYSSVLAVTLNVIFSIIFYYMFGYLGPAISTGLTKIGSVFFILIYTSKTLYIPISKLLPFMNVFLILLINVIFAALFYFISKYVFINSNIILKTIVLCLIWFALYLYILRKKIKILFENLNHC